MRNSSISRFLDPDPHTRAAFEAELARGPPNPELQPLLRRESPDLWARFARYYDHLTRLPRRVRRGLQREWKRSLSGVALLLALGQAPALAATITVGGSCTLVDAITAANTDIATNGCPAGSGADVIRLTADVTLTTVNNTMEGPNGLPPVTSTITLNGRDHTVQRSTVTGTPEFRLLHVADTGDLKLNQITLSNGRAPDDVNDFFSPRGGGVFNRGTVVLNDSTISDSSAYFYGGGVANFSQFTLTNSTVSGNTARYGGGVASTEGMLTLSNSTVSGNSAYRSGGVNNRGTLTVTDSTISGNSASFNCGGVYSTAGTLTLTNSTVSGNSALSGGGVCPALSRITDSAIITNSVISGNTATYVGGGVYSRGNTTVTDSTVSGNTAGTNGGGVAQYAGFLTLTNSTLSGNTAGDKGGGVYNGNLLTLTRSLISGNTGPNGAEVHNYTGPYGSASVYADNFNLFGHADVTDADAFVGFVPGASDITATSDGTTPTALAGILDPTLASNGGPTQTHALVAGSPAIDAAGSGCPPPATDQRGFARPVDGDGDSNARCDTGAVEFVDCENAVPTNGCRVNGIPDQLCKGTNSSDTILGTNANDVILGRGSSDLLRGRAGHDLICGGGGDDEITGGTGGDLIDGQAGGDEIFGAEGPDRLQGGKGSDEIKGGPGDDFLDGGPGRDELNGQQGTDTCVNGEEISGCP